MKISIDHHPLRMRKLRFEKTEKTGTRKLKKFSVFSFSSTIEKTEKFYIFIFDGGGSHRSWEGGRLSVTAVASFFWSPPLHT